MFILGVAVLCYCGVALATVALGTNHTPPIVELAYGTFEGTTADDISLFLGVPFANPPIGPLRFAPPQWPEPFTGIREAISYGPACPQQPAVTPDVLPITVPTVPAPSNQSEDYINTAKVQMSSKRTYPQRYTGLYKCQGDSGNLKNWLNHVKIQACDQIRYFQSYT